MNVRSSQVKSSLNAIQKNITLRISLERTPHTAKNQIKELALIIAEVYMLPPDARVRIDRADLPACMVQAVFDDLTPAHAQMVIDNFRALPYEVKHKKTYLRTALYNSVFELSAHYYNQAKKDL